MSITLVPGGELNSSWRRCHSDGAAGIGCPGWQSSPGLAFWKRFPLIPRLWPHRCQFDSPGAWTVIASVFKEWPEFKPGWGCVSPGQADRASSSSTWWVWSSPDGLWPPPDLPSSLPSRCWPWLTPPFCWALCLTLACCFVRLGQGSQGLG